MGLLSTYGANNRVITEGKTVSYNQEMIFQNFSYQATPTQVITYNQEYQIRRFCTKSYKYVGMDYNTALSCASDMITKYTRQVKSSLFNYNSTGDFVDVVTGNILMADIAVRQTVACMYEVDVYVREEDTRMRLNPVQDPSALFTAENSRDYDEN